MFCRKCGSQIDDNLTVCPNCNNVILAEKQAVNQEAENIANEVVENKNSDENPVPNINVYNNLNYAMNYNAPKKNDKKGFAIASFVLSLVAIPSCCCNIYLSATPLLPILSILAIIFGIIGISSKLKGLAIAGICLGGLGLLMYIVFVCLILFPSPLQEFQNRFWDEIERYNYSNGY